MLKSLFCRLIPRPTSTSAVRYFSPSKKSLPYADDRYRGEHARDYGYRPHHHDRGLLPRLKIKEARLPTMPITAKEDPWSQRQVTMGQNDFMSILGDDEDFKQYELLDNVPDWLRGYKNCWKEYSVLQRRRKEFDHWKYTKPKKWGHIESRIKFLYRRINNKYHPPDVEQLSRPRYRP